MSRNKEIFINNLIPEQLTSTTTIQRPIGVDLFYSDLSEAQTRRTLSDQVRNLFNQVQDVHLDFDQALDQKLINQNEVAEFYHHLSDFISSDPHHSRLILYLPFQILSNPNHTQNRSVQFIESQHKFTQTYKNAWIQQLFESDIRADFVDGDVLEPGLGEPPLVRKAAHLIPEILNKSIISRDEINQILEINKQDLELCSSIADGLSVVDSNFKQTINIETFNLNNFNQEISAPYFSRGSTKRVVWENSVQHQKIINKYALQISDPKIIESLFAFESSNFNNKLLGLKSIFNHNNLTDNFDILIKKSWNSGNHDIKDLITIGLRHWQKKGIIDYHYLDNFGIKVPDLSLPFSINLEDQKYFDTLALSVEKIKNNPELSANLYPFILVFGSRIKGYASSNSDIDAAVFFKPTASFEKREEILNSLHQTIPQFNQIDKLLEYWIKNENNTTTFKTNIGNINTQIGASEVHFLINGVWIGSQTDISQFSQDLSKKYFNLSRFDSQKDQVRFQFLRQLENDVLQCRLMHKGYRSVYPNQKPERFSNMSSIDGHSDFWDPGYRRVATQLFLSRVFLPDLSK